jgi:protease-4
MDATDFPPSNPTSNPASGPTPVPPAAPPPPLIIPPSPTKPKKGGRGWMILALILFALLAFSLLANFGQMVGSLTTLTQSAGRSTGPRLEEIIVKDNGSANKVAVIPVEGIITGDRIDGTAFNLVEVIKEQLQRAKNDKRVKAVVLSVDSPGGEVLASDEIANALRKFQDDTSKPVVVSMGNLAASGGYYVSAPCRWIVANDMTITGSIGVIMSGLNYRGLMDKVGLEPRVYKSGKYKDMLSGSRKPEDISPEEDKMINALIQEVYGKFKTVVGKGRQKANEQNGSDGRKLIANWSEYADGRVLSGTQAFELGFVDELGNFDTALKRALRLCGAANANVVEYQQIIDLADIFRMFGQSDSKGVKVDLGIEAPKLKAGQPYFLYSEFLF